jgi:hypothetical protein
MPRLQGLDCIRMRSDARLSREVGGQALDLINVAEIMRRVSPFTAPLGLYILATNVRVVRTSRHCAPFSGDIRTRIWDGPVDHASSNAIQNCYENRDGI